MHCFSGGATYEGILVPPTVTVVKCTLSNCLIKICSSSGKRLSSSFPSTTLLPVLVWGLLIKNTMVGKRVPLSLRGYWRTWSLYIANTLTASWPRNTRFPARAWKGDFFGHVPGSRQYTGGTVLVLVRNPASTGIWRL